MKVIVKQGYTFNYRTSGIESGAIANISNPMDLVLDVKKINDYYHVDYTICGVYTQIWCKSYNIERINKESGLSDIIHFSHTP